MTDTSKEAVERFIERCWLTDPDPDRTETMVRALFAERDSLQETVNALHSAQSYTYIGKDGVPVLARDLEDQRDALQAKVEAAETVLSMVRSKGAHAAGRKEALEEAISVCERGDILTAGSATAHLRQCAVLAKLEKEKT